MKDKGEAGVTSGKTQKQEVNFEQSGYDAGVFVKSGTPCP